MNQLLVISGKKITSSHDNRVLFQPDKAGVELDHWVENTFLTKVLRKEERHDLFLNIVYISELKTPKYGLISISAAKKLLETDPNNAEIVAFLSSLQAKLSIQFEYGIRDGRVVSISEIKPEEHGLRYSCEKHEVSIAEVLRANNARIAVHAYYGTEDARRNINNFLRKYDIPFEESTYCRRLSRKADKSIVDCAKSIWGEGNVKIPPFHYLYVREYNMPKSSIFPAAMLKNPKLMINLLFQNDELNHITN